MENNELLNEETIPSEEAQSSGEEGGLLEENFEDEAVLPSEQTNGSEGEDDESEQEPPFSIRYKHQNLNLTRQEAVRLAQLGKHFEDNVSGVFNQLDYLAVLENKTVKEFVEGLVNTADENYRRELTEKLGEDNALIEEMLELKKSKNKQRYEATIEQRQIASQREEADAKKSDAERLQSQFEAVRRLFPEYKTAEDLPETILRRATEGADLEKEVLRFRLLEDRRIEQAKQKSAQNKGASIGSVYDAETESGSDYAFLRGLWGN